MATKKTVRALELEETDDELAGFPLGKELLAIDPAFAREALALPAGIVVPLRVNLTYARSNAVVAASAVLGARKAIEKKVKEPNFKAVERLEALVDATQAASRALLHIEKATSTYDTDIARVWPLRSRVLGMAEVLADAGLLPKTAVEAIRAGTGNLDAAKDLIDLADLFTKNARKLVGMMGPVTKEDLVEAKQLGKRLVDTIKPSKGRVPKPIDTQRREAVDLRDRLNTLLVTDYETTWFLGAAAFGSKVDNFVPPLGSGRRESTPAAEKPKLKPPKSTAKKAKAEDAEADSGE